MIAGLILIEHNVQAHVKLVSSKRIQLLSKIKSRNSSPGGHMRKELLTKNAAEKISSRL
jgi:hypothetical protein